jgi:hypothetical protein
MKLLISILMMVLFCIDMSAQKVAVQKKVSGTVKAIVPAKKGVGRYEILVFPETLIKLDTFTGQTYSNSFPDGFISKTWLLAEVSAGLPDESSSVVSKYRVWRQEPDRRDAYPRYTYYLLNTETGQTWVSSKLGKSYLAWEPFSGN